MATDDNEAAAAKDARRLAAAAESARKVTVGLGAFEKLPARAEVMAGLQRVLVAAGRRRDDERPDDLDTDTMMVFEKGSLGVRRVVVPTRPVSLAPPLLTVHAREVEVTLPLRPSAGRDAACTARVHCVSQRELAMQLVQAATEEAMGATTAAAVAEWAVDCERAGSLGRGRSLGELLLLSGVHAWHLRWFSTQGILHVPLSRDESRLPRLVTPSPAKASPGVGFESWCADVCGILPEGPVSALQHATALPLRPGLRLLSWNLRDLTLSGASIVEFLEEFYAEHPEHRPAASGPAAPLRPKAELPSEDPLFQPVLDLEAVRRADPEGCRIVGRDGTSIHRPERPRSLAHMRRLAKMCTVMQSFDVVVAQELLDDKALPWMARRLSAGSSSAEPVAAAAVPASSWPGQLWAAHTSPFLGRRARRHRHGVLWRQDKLRMLSLPQPLRNTKSFERPPMLSVFQVIATGRVLIVVGVHSVYGSSPHWRSLEARSLFTVLAAMLSALLERLVAAGEEPRDEAPGEAGASPVEAGTKARRRGGSSKPRPQMSRVVASLAERGIDVVAAGDFNLSWADQCFTRGRKPDGQAWMVPPKPSAETAATQEAASGAGSGARAGSGAPSMPDLADGAPFVPVCVETSGSTLSGTMLDQIWLASPVAARQWTGRGGVIRLLEYPRWLLHGAGGITTGVIGAIRRAVGDRTVAVAASDPLPEFLGPGAIVAGDTRKIMSSALSDHVPSWVELGGQEALAASQQFSEAALEVIAALLR
jgi:hypothetical protein